MTATSTSHGGDDGSTAELRRELERALARAVGRLRVVVLAYDGVLVPYASRPELASPDDDLLGLLARLASRPDTEVHVVSGRAHTTLEAWLGDLPVTLHAEHGLWRRARPLHAWVGNLVTDPRRWAPAVEEVLRDAVADVPGSLLERKSAGFAWHYRNATPVDATAARERIRERLAFACLEHGLVVVEGSDVLEVRPDALGRARVVDDVLRDRTNTFVFAAGSAAEDDVLDEVEGRGGFAVCVGDRRAPNGRRALDGAEVRALLEELVHAPPASRPWALVVDDDPDVRELVGAALRSVPMLVHDAPDVPTALERLREDGPAPALVVTDVHMPELDGFHLVEAMRADPRLANVSTVVISAAPHDAPRVSGISVLRKPVPREVLVELACRALARAARGQ